jgi:3-methyl-2-oxobutanoate hydroxymethyltransferase
MPYLKPERPEKVSAPSLRSSKQRGERLVCLTAYDYPTARILDEAGIDIILVGDSLGNVVLGYGNTVPVTLDEILIHLKAVRRAVQRALLVADMPYGTFHTGDDDAVRNALRLVKEGGAEAIKLEGGHKRVQLVKRLVDEEVSVMGHIGLTPQSINQLGAYRVQGKTPRAAQQLIDDAKALEDAGAFADDHGKRSNSDDRDRRRRSLRHSGAGPARHAWSVVRQTGAVRAAIRELA